MLRPVAHQVHQANRARLLAAERKARVKVKDADRMLPLLDRADFGHAAGSAAIQASIAARAAGSSIVGA